MYPFNLSLRFYRNEMEKRRPERVGVYFLTEFLWRIEQLDSFCRNEHLSFLVCRWLTRGALRYRGTEPLQEM